MAIPPLNKMFPNKIIHVQKIIKKSTKSVFRIDTTDKTVFLYQFFDTRFRHRLKFQIDLMNDLRSNNIAVPFPVRFENGEYLFSDEASVFWASENLPDSKVLLRQELDFTTMKSIVKQVRRLHTVLRSYPSHDQRIPHDFEAFGKELSPSFLSTLVRLYEDDIRAVRSVGKQVLKNHDYLQHGDLTYRNILEIPNSYAYIDFDRVHHGPQIADLFSLIVSNPFPEIIPENFHDMVLYDHLLEVYEIYDGQTPLTIKEFICGLVEWIFRIIEKGFHWYEENKKANDFSNRNLVNIINKVSYLGMHRF